MSAPIFSGDATSSVSKYAMEIANALAALANGVNREGQGRNPQRIAALLRGAGGPMTTIGGEVSAETDPPPSGGFVLPGDPLLGRNVNTTE